MTGQAHPQDHPQGHQQNHGISLAGLAQIDVWMQDYVDAGKYAGSSLLIARNGSEVHFNATGCRDIDSGAPFMRDTLVRIMSMTKPITTVALMMLVERGLVTLDMPVSDFITGFAKCTALIPGATAIDQTEPCATPTLHQLLTHTGGMSYWFNPGVLPGEMATTETMFSPRRGTLEEMVDQVATLPLAFQPGTRWEYSVGLDIIGRVIEIVSGQSLDQFFQDNIFDPLGMTETGFSVPSSAVSRFASLYSPLTGDGMALNADKPDQPVLNLVETAQGSPYLNATLLAGGGGLVGTIDDFLKFCEMLRNGGVLAGNRLLAPDTVADMLRNHLPGDIASMGPASFAEQPMMGMGFGLGGAVVLDPAVSGVPGCVGDFSWGGIASTFFWIDMARGVSCIFFTQLTPSSTYPSRAELKTLVNAALIG